jgi:CSLREA domain-containing protein
MESKTHGTLATRSGPLSVLIVLALVMALTLGRPPIAYAAGFTITTTADTNDGVCDADCSLREAIGAANAAPDPDTIRVPAGTYVLALGRLSITTDLSIRGAGASKTLLDGGALDKVLEITSGQVTITGLTIQNGQGEDGAGIDNSGALLLSNCVVRGNHDEEDGGGIRNAGTLTMKDCSVSGNTAMTGGGIYNLGTATITSSAIRANLAIEGGGGLRNTGTATLRGSVVRDNATVDGSGAGVENGGTLTLINSTISGNNAKGLDGGGGIANSGSLTISGGSVDHNQAQEVGGGIFNRNPGQVQLTHVTIGDNSATEDGGGIFNHGALALDGATMAENHAQRFGGGIYNAGTLTLQRSTLNGNESVENGGAVYNTSTGKATLTNSTVSGNSAQGFGGGIFNLGGTVSLNNVTITANRADANGDGLGDGGGAANQLLGNAEGLFTIQNTIIAGNRDKGGEAPDCVGTLTSLGYNLIGSLAGCTIVGKMEGNIIGDPRLRPLADNGGPTRTHALKPGSPAIDAGAACASTDQRGVSRPQGSACDIGAYERRVD